MGEAEQHPSHRARSRNSPAVPHIHQCPQARRVYLHERPLEVLGPSTHVPAVVYRRHLDHGDLAADDGHAGRFVVLLTEHEGQVSAIVEEAHDRSCFASGLGAGYLAPHPQHSAALQRELRAVPSFRATAAQNHAFLPAYTYVRYLIQLEEKARLLGEPDPIGTADLEAAWTQANERAMNTKDQRYLADLTDRYQEAIH